MLKTEILGGLLWWKPWSIIRVVKAGSMDLARLQKPRSEMKLMQSKVISVGLEGKKTPLRTSGRQIGLGD